MPMLDLGAKCQEAIDALLKRRSKRLKLQRSGPPPAPEPKTYGESGDGHTSDGDTGN